MRFADFLIALLIAQGETLARMAALFGEDITFEMLEAAGEKMDDTDFQSTFTDLPREWFESQGPSLAPQGVSPYAEIKGAVLKLDLAEPLEFHLWAYPYYRFLIENQVDLNARISTANDAGEKLIEHAIQAVETWAKFLPIPQEFQKQSMSAIRAPWVRFRTDVLKRLGKKPLGTVG